MISGSVQGLDVVVRGLADYGVRAKEYATRGTVEALQIGYRASVKMISAEDHSIQQLAAMGHPYAVRDPQPPHVDPVIHKQTGEYLAGLRVEGPVGYFDRVEGRIVNEDPKDRWLQDGTTKMIARPWMEFVVGEVGPEMEALVIAAIERGIARDAA